jgi:hypothetical protein
MTTFSSDQVRLLEEDSWKYAEGAAINLHLYFPFELRAGL